VKVYQGIKGKKSVIPLKEVEVRNEKN